MSPAISFLLVIIVFSHVDLYLRAAQIVNLIPGFWSVFVAMLAMTSWILSSRKVRGSTAYSVGDHRRNQRHLYLWALVFAASASFSYLFSGRAPGMARALVTLANTLWMLSLFLVIFRGQREIQAARIAMAVVVVVSVVNNLVDLSGIYAFSDTDIRGIRYYRNPDGRGSGFYVNPNVSGLYLVLGMILTAAIIPSRYRLRYCMLVGVGVVATFSRASILIWFLSLFALAQAKSFRLDRRLVVALVGGLASLIVAMQFSGAIVQAFGLERYLSENALERLHYDASADRSVQGRLSVAERSLSLIREAPFFGHGFGAASTPPTFVESHNMLLLIGVEMGAFGVLVYLSMYVVLWRMGSYTARILSGALFVGSLFSHDILDNASMWLAFSILCGAAATDKGRQHHQDGQTRVLGGGRVSRVSEWSPSGLALNAAIEAQPRIVQRWHGPKI